MVKHNNSKQRAICFLAGAAALVATGVVDGQSSGRTSTAKAFVPVTATVSRRCTISTVSALAFDSYSPIGTNAAASLSSSGQVSIACSKGAVGMTIGVDNGAHFTLAQRHMVGAKTGAFLYYEIFRPPGNAPGAVCTYPGATPWNASGAGLLTLSSSTAKTARVYNVCGTIPAGQDVPADSYSDSIAVTLNF